MFNGCYLVKISVVLAYSEGWKSLLCLESRKGQGLYLLFSSKTPEGNTQQLCNLWDPLQSKNVETLVQTLKRISTATEEHQTKQRSLCNYPSCMPRKLALPTAQPVLLCRARVHPGQSKKNNLKDRERRTLGTLHLPISLIPHWAGNLWPSYYDLQGAGTGPSSTNMRLTE